MDPLAEDEFVKILQEVETGAGDGGRGSAAGARQPAPDEKRECLDREEVLGQAPDREGVFFRVPPVIEREGGGES